MTNEQKATSSSFDDPTEVARRYEAGRLYRKQSGTLLSGFVKIPKVEVTNKPLIGDFVENLLPDLHPAKPSKNMFAGRDKEHPI